MASFRAEVILKGMIVAECSYLRRVVSKAAGTRD